MIEWLNYKNKFQKTDPRIFSEVRIHDQLACIVFYEKSEKTLFFGFITDFGVENPNLMIKEIESYAVEARLDTIIGPIDANTWNNYRFVYSDHLSIDYPGRPKYSTQLCHQFISQGYDIFESYETVKISSIEKIKSECSKFSLIETHGLYIEKLSSQHFIEHKEDFLDLLNNIFIHNLGYSELHNDIVEFIIEEMKLSVSYDYSAVVFDQAKMIVGFLISYMINGKLYIKTVGVLNQYRYQGLTVLKLMDFILNKNNSPKVISDIYICLMRKGNFPSMLSQIVSTERNEYVLLRRKIL